MSQAYVHLCLMSLEHSSNKKVVLAYIHKCITEQGQHFKTIADSFTQSYGLDLIFKNLQNKDLPVLDTILALMATDDFVGVKLLKLKLLSNLIMHFSDNPTLPKIIDQISKNQHWPTLLHQSQQFDEEKNRLLDLSTSKNINPKVKNCLIKLISL